MLTNLPELTCHCVCCIYLFTVKSLQAYKTKDGKFLIIGAGNNAHFTILCQVLKMEELLSDERFATNSQRVAHRDTLIPLLSQRC